jgi:hypothetical protein
VRRDWVGFSPEPSISEARFDVCHENDYFGKSTCMEYFIDDQKRHWHEIADALLREAKHEENGRAADGIESGVW